MNKIKYALVFFAGLLMFSCSESDEAVLYDNYDFISIKGDSVISSDGLQMVASTVDITSDYTFTPASGITTPTVFKVFQFSNGFKSVTMDITVSSFSSFTSGEIFLGTLTKNGSTGNLTPVSFNGSGRLAYNIGTNSAKFYSGTAMLLEDGRIRMYYTPPTSNQPQSTNFSIMFMSL